MVSDTIFRGGEINMSEIHKGHELIETGENQVRCQKCGMMFYRQPFRDMDDVPPCPMEVR